MSSTFATGSYDGRILLWKDGKGEASVVPGFGHTNQVTNFSSDGDLMYSAGMDDTVKTLSLAEGEAK